MRTSLETQLERMAPQLRPLFQRRRVRRQVDVQSEALAHQNVVLSRLVQLDEGGDRRSDDQSGGVGDRYVHAAPGAELEVGQLSCVHVRAQHAGAELEERSEPPSLE